MALIRASRLTKFICTARMPKSRLRSAAELLASDMVATSDRGLRSINPLWSTTRKCLFTTDWLQRGTRSSAHRYQVSTEAGNATAKPLEDPSSYTVIPRDFVDPHAISWRQVYRQVTATYLPASNRCKTHWNDGVTNVPRRCCAARHRLRSHLGTRTSQPSNQC